jgi:transcriptional regulator with AAA-type ATPase domain
MQSVVKYIVGIPMEARQLDKKSAAVFSNLIKEESYPQFEVRAMLLGEKGTGKTTVARFLLQLFQYNEKQKARHCRNSSTI